MMDAKELLRRSPVLLDEESLKAAVQVVENDALAVGVSPSLIVKGWVFYGGRRAQIANAVYEKHPT